MTGIRFSLLAGTMFALSACSDGGGMPFLGSLGGGASDVETTRGATSTTKLIEREVEAPEIFQMTELGSWDGQPALGGVWVAHPDIKEPDRVIIRNQDNGTFVIGSLFWRQPEGDALPLQVSSEAAAALQMKPGGPATLEITALRRRGDDTAEDAAPVQAAAAPAPSPAPALEAAPVETKPLPVAATPSTSTLNRAFVQLGIFSVEGNALRTVERMRNAGLTPAIKTQSINGKPYYRVIVGPAQTEAERARILQSVKDQGFSDAYAVAD
ncbi:MAG: SPOR domain-containing protein [Shimia sp.]